MAATDPMPNVDESACKAGAVHRWGTDATQIATVEDGRVWLFAVVEHWNAEALGWHVAKRGDRFAAVRAAGMAGKRVSGALAVGAARGVMLRHDHGGAFMADHFRHQLRFRGLAPSYAFVAEPETNGVAERFFRSLKRPEPGQDQSGTIAIPGRRPDE